ncbi:MAG: hypothetical protein U0841_25935 [Chloroflexia bacterium]
MVKVPAAAVRCWKASTAAQVVVAWAGRLRVWRDAMRERQSAGRGSGTRRWRG